MHAKLASTSAVAIALMLAAPGLAQETTTPEADETTEIPEAEAPEGEEAPDVEDLAETMVGPSITSEEMREILSAAFEDVEPFSGAAIYGRDDEGRAFLFLLGPRDFTREADGAATIPDEHPDFQNRLAEAGLPQVQGDIHRVVMQATIDGHYVLAIGGHEHSDAAYVGAEMPPVHTDMADFDDEAFRERLTEAGIEDVDQLEAQLFHARAEAGQSIYFLFGPEGFAAGETVELEEADIVERLEEAGLENVERADDDFRFVRGEHEDHSVLAIVGPIDHWGAADN